MLNDQNMVDFEKKLNYTIGIAAQLDETEYFGNNMYFLNKNYQIKYLRWKSGVLLLCLLFVQQNPLQQNIWSFVVLVPEKTSPVELNYCEAFLGFCRPLVSLYL